MIAFFVVATALVAIALAWVLTPLLRARTRSGVARRASNLSIYQDQFAELEADLARGTLSQDRFDEARAELERRMLDDAQADAGEVAPTRIRAKWTAWGVGLLLPVFAALLYIQFGDPNAFDPMLSQARAPDGGPEHGMDAAQVDKMTSTLEERLKQEPGNIDGWVMLARTYYATGKFDKAVSAFAVANKLVPDEPTLLADHADALAMSRGRKISGEPLALVQRALKIDPTQWKALAMAGTEAFDRQDYKAAVGYWERLRDSVPTDSPIGQSILRSIDEARRLAGMAPLAPAAGAAGAAAAAMPPAKGAAASAAPAKAAAATPVVLTGTIALSRELAGKVGPDDTVFIVARPATGARMPLAFTRAKVRDLPLQFKLDDSMAMSPDMALSTAAQVVVGARVSKSGAPMPAPGDFEGASAAVANNATGVVVTIDRAVP